MAKNPLYWLGEGVLKVNDPKDASGRKKIKLGYADLIPEGALTPERIKKLKKDGVIGSVPKPVAATETARLQHQLEEQKGVIEALTAGEGGEAIARIEELETDVKNHVAKITELEGEKGTLVTENLELQNKVTELEEKLTTPNSDTGSGVGAKDKK